MSEMKKNNHIIISISSDSKPHLSTSRLDGAIPKRQRCSNSPIELSDDSDSIEPADGFKCEYESRFLLNRQETTAASSKAMTRVITEN